jgi:hypothetical protein
MCEPIWMQLIGADGTGLEWSGTDRTGEQRKGPKGKNTKLERLFK